MQSAPQHLSVLFALALLAPSSAQGQEGAPARDGHLAPLTDIGPVLPEDEDSWRLMRFLPGESSDTITLRHQDENFLVENTTIQASARTAFIAYQGSGPYTGTTLRNCIVKVEPGTLPLDRSYWAIRGYDMVDTTLERVEITGFGKVTRKHDEGHGIYFNVAGALTIEHCDIHHNGGQALQLVNRPKESVLPRAAAAGAITVRHTSFRENGFNPDRGGFQVSIFGTGQDIVLEDVEILAGLDGTTFPGDLTGGALLIEPEGFDPRRPEKPVWWRPERLPADFEAPFGQGRTELTRVRIAHRAPNRPLVQIKSCSELIVRDCEFNGGKIELDHPKKPGRDSGRIVWEGNRGHAAVFVRGRMVGHAEDDFIIEPPAKDDEEQGGRRR